MYIKISHDIYFAQMHFFHVCKIKPSSRLPTLFI